MNTIARSEQKRRTREILLREARRLFAERGYGAVGLAEIVESAGVTKGALYHHFGGGKTDLFRAVLRQVQAEVGEAVAAAEAHTDPWQQLITGCETFLDASTDPARQRIMLIDGPAVLGWAEWRAMDEANSERHLAEALTELIEAGVLARQPVKPLTHLLSGAMNEAALWLATSDEPQDLTDTKRVLRRLLEALKK